MSHTPLTVICPGENLSPRFIGILKDALAGKDAEILQEISAPLHDRRILFAVSLDDAGQNEGLYRLLGQLRRKEGLLTGSAAGILVDGGDLYTKSTARELALTVNQSDCTLIGRPLVEGTSDLRNFTVQAKNAGCGLEEAYRRAAADLVRRIEAFSPPKHRRPKVTVLHASSHRTSNTMALWMRIRPQLEDCCDITEIGLRNGTMEDCAGCPYTMCLHFGEKGECFYGGVMVREVYPAVRDADAVVLLCPNYNDALSANLTAAINRLTALYRTTPFTDKAVYAIVVSGYSGGDIVAAQVVSAMCMNKGFYLPAASCLMETANTAGEALALPDIENRLADFAARIRRQLCQQP